MEETRKAHRAGLDLDHAVAMVHERTKAPLQGTAERRRRGRGGGKEMKLTSTEANVSGIMHWLDKTSQPTSGQSCQ